VPLVQSSIFTFINDLCRYWSLPSISLTWSLFYVLLTWYGFICHSLSISNFSLLLWQGSHKIYYGFSIFNKQNLTYIWLYRQSTYIFFPLHIQYHSCHTLHLSVFYIHLKILCVISLKCLFLTAGKKFFEVLRLTTQWCEFSLFYEWLVPANERHPNVILLVAGMRKLALWYKFSHTWLDNLPIFSKPN
jgi:hypothetical protein